ncbi:MAG: DUF4097 family beta strand repeat-containing protein [Bacteroidota bacterium]
MKISIYKAMLFGWLLAIAMPTLQANDGIAKGKKEFKKTINKEFPISADGKVGLHNKFGDLNVRTWDKNEVKIDITITVHANNQEQANKVFNRINVRFSNSSNNVRAETIMGSNRGGSWNGWWNGSDNTSFDIDYEVYMPRSVELDLSIKHGDAYITELNGEASIDVRHSDLRVDAIMGDLELEVAHGDAELTTITTADIDIAHGDLKIKSAKNVRAEVQHGEMYLRNAKKLDCNSAHSELEFGDIPMMRVDSKHDELEIERTHELDLDAKYSDVEIEHIENNIKCDMDFGELQINNISSNFKEVRLDGTHTSFDLSVPSNASFDLDALGEHANIDYPSRMDIQYEKEKSSTHEVRGHMGSANSGSLIHIRMRHGGVDIDL